MKDIDKIELENNDSTVLWSIIGLLCCFILGTVAFISGIVYLIFS